MQTCGKPHPAQTMNPVPNRELLGAGLFQENHLNLDRSPAITSTVVCQNKSESNLTLARLELTLSRSGLKTKNDLTTRSIG
jgi:hypothetical protein